MPSERQPGDPVDWSPVSSPSGEPLRGAAKGRNRDTAWYAIADDDWPAVRAAFESWLAQENFDADGSQKRPLEVFMPPRE